MRAAILCSLLLLSGTVLGGWGVSAARADDLDVLVDTGVSGETRGEAYARLTKAEFAPIAKKLATLIGTHRTMSGVGARSKEPWKEARLSEGDRIAFTLMQLWNDHTVPEKRSRANFDLMLELLEDPTVGLGRHWAMTEVAVGLRARPDRENPKPGYPPPASEVVPRLSRLAKDEATPKILRRSLLEVLFAHGDANDYVDLAMELAGSETTPLARREYFRFSTEAITWDKLTDANRKKYVRHCFTALEQIDDGKEGHGYFMALHMGRFIENAPNRRGENMFAPKSKSAYRDANGLNKSYFQDTVNGARKWWEENKASF